MNKKLENLKFVFGFIVFLMSVSNAVAADKVIQSTDLTYIGAFRVPSGTYGGSDDTKYSFNYAGFAMPIGVAYNAANNSLIMSGHGNNSYVAEINIPAIVNSSNISALNIATVRQNFTDVSRGHHVFTNEGLIIGGFLVYNGKLIVGATDYYAFDNAQETWSHFVNSNANSLATGTFAGDYTVTSTGNGGPPVSISNEYMTTVPDNSSSGGTNWQTALGGTVLAGAMSPNIVSRTSLGPAAVTFNPDNFSSNTPHNVLMYWPGDGSHSPADSVFVGSGLGEGRLFWNGSTQLNGVVFPNGTKTVLYFGNTGTGTTVCYKNGNPTAWGCDAIVNGDTARPVGAWDIHAPTYRNQIWAVNADDLLAVKNGSKNPWDITPAIWPISSPFDTSEHFIAGAAYDPATQRIYVVEGKAESGKLPIVLVYQVNASSASADATAPTITSFTMPASASSNTVAVTSLSATDNVAVTGYCTTSTNSSSGCSWSASPPATVSFQSSGTQTVYAWAKDAAGNVSQPATATVTVTIASSDTSAPTVPAAPSVTSVSSTQVNLSWTASTDNVGVSGYKIYRNGTQVGTSTATTYQDTGLTPNTAYSYTLSAFDAASNVSAKSSATSVTTSAIVTTSTYNGFACNASTLPITGTRIVNVSTEPQLQTAISNLQSGDTIVLADGTYNLTKSIVINGISNITLRGNTGCDGVVLTGQGMDNSGGVGIGIWSSSSNTTVAHLTIKNTYDNAITFDAGAQSPHVYSVKLIDIGSQFIKGNPTYSGSNVVGGVNNGIVEYTWVEYTNGGPATDHGAGAGYFNGISLHGSSGWQIRKNLFKNLHNPDSAAWWWNPAVLTWNHSSNTVTEQNVFINCDRAIAYGLEVPTTTIASPMTVATDHSGGVIRNNFVYMQPNYLSSARKADSDAQILVWDSPSTLVYHNTVLANGNVTSSVEARFSTTGAQAKNNLVDTQIRANRDGGTFTLSGNYASAATGMFLNSAIGDLHLVDNASTEANVIHKVTAPASATTDFDGDARPSGASSDIGADQFVSGSFNVAPAGLTGTWSK
ncbi:fibronectin type III domain-containing protein [Geobacter sp. AOG2]|uniref:fibronectin type III domain-containing protein n=1 Tax=Geobacter sp. AOG2 TaxID=1566347 RepID=UPI001CC64A54|nr:fibronectin type III domain-containing protein [Geobacter sp. AOG2]GFE60848.1 hypothetical protein AOG2_14350 [Geobacter sp. AOG2]